MFLICLHFYSLKPISRPVLATPEEYLGTIWLVNDFDLRSRVASIGNVKLDFPFLFIKEILGRLFEGDPEIIYKLYNVLTKINIFKNWYSQKYIFWKINIFGNEYFKKVFLKSSLEISTLRNKYFWE